MIRRAFFLHALSPLHAGTGHSAEVIDLPIARMTATGIPFLPASSIKGVLRDDRRAPGDGTKEKVRAVFGDVGDEGDNAGALTVADARLLTLPVRSFRGVFAWVSSPLLLRLAIRDLNASLRIPEVDGNSLLVSPDCLCVHDGKVYLEDLDIEAKYSEDISQWSRLIHPHVSPGDDIFSRRFIITSDETMAFLWETATQVDTRIRIDGETRTAAKGALWTEESLPPETVLIGLFEAMGSRKNGVKMSPEEVLDFAVPGETVLQFGGKASIGRGRCRLIPLNSGGGENA